MRRLALPRSLWAPTPPPPLDVYPPRVRRLIRRLRTPERVQDWLDRLPYNWERRAETLFTLPRVVRRGTAHCLEAALAAAAILEHHGHPPILMDLESVDQLDHVLFVFRRGGRFGTVARSRDPGLHGRKPHYRTLRSLVMSYSAPYIDLSGRLKGYGVLDLRTMGHVDWRASERNVWAVEQRLIDHAHARFHVGDAFYRRWHERYAAFKREHPHARPTFYPNQRHWLGAMGLRRGPVADEH